MKGGWGKRSVGYSRSEVVHNMKEAAAGAVHCGVVEGEKGRVQGMRMEGKATLCKASKEELVSGKRMRSTPTTKGGRGRDAGRRGSGGR